MYKSYEMIISKLHVTVNTNHFKTASKLFLAEKFYFTRKGNMRKHIFDADLACIFGVEKAIILENFSYWISKNLENNKNIHDGKAYIYSSYDALKELFPYMKLNTIKRHIRELESDNILSSRTDLNESKFDKTKWYTIEVEKISLEVGK